MKTVTWRAPAPRWRRNPPAGFIRPGGATIDLAFRKQIENGIADGSIVPCDAKLAAFAIADALNGIADWYQPGGALSPEAIADEFATRLTAGLVARAARAPARKKS